MNARWNAVLVTAAGLVASLAQAGVPDSRLISAPLVAPATFSGSTTHTGTWTNTPEIVALARGLGSDRLAASQISPDQYVLNVFNYVRSNIAVEFRYGLGKGARGALLDQSGTPFDQAELMLRLVNAAGSGQITATFRYGTVTHDEQRFGLWSGLVTNLVQSTQTFDVKARAACQFLADGGIPATVNGVSDCNSITGNPGPDVTNVTMSHVWVGVTTPTGTKLYDPSFKEHALKSGIDLPSAMGCGTAGSSTCGSSVASSLMSGTGSSTFAGSPYIENLNYTNGANTLTAQATALKNSLVATTANRFAQTIDIVGGKALAPAALTPGTVLPYTSSELNSWSEIPDALRTTLTITAVQCGITFYADEIAGKRISFVGGAGTDNGGGVTNLLIDGVNTACANGGSALGTVMTITLAVNHPYPASGGTYADDTTSFNGVEAERFETGVFGQPFHASSGGTVSGGAQSANPPNPDWFENQISLSFPVTIVHGFGDASTSSQQFLSDLQSVSAPIMNSYLCRPATSTSFFQRTCGNDTQVVAAEAVGAYRTLADRIIAGVTRTAITRHHDIGVIFSSRTPGVSRISVKDTSSVVSPTVDSAARDRAFEMGAMLMTLGEAAAGSGDGLSGDDFSTFNFFITGRRFFDVAPASMAALLAALPNRAKYDMFALGFEPWRKTQLQSVADAGYSVIIGNGAESSLLYSSNSRAYTIWENLKGASAPDDPVAAAMKTTEVIDAASLRRREYSVAPADGALTMQAVPDIVTGAGEFPMSLPFVRTFKAGAKDRNTTSSAAYFREGQSGQEDTLAVHMRGGWDSDAYARLGGGWTHNYNVTAAFTGNAAKGFGEDLAVEAASMIAGAVALNDLFANTTFQNRLASMYTASRMHSSLFANAIVVKKGPASETFVRLPDGNYIPSGASSAKFRIATPANSGHTFEGMVLEYTGDNGDVISFTPSFVPFILISDNSATSGESPTFRANSWTFPTGLRVDFDYELLPVTNSSTLSFCDFWGSCTYGLYTSKAFVLLRVRNNLGRSLTFTRVPYVDTNGFKNGYRITAVTDETSRHADFSVSCTKLHCDTFTATDPALGATRYEYAPDANSPNPSVLVKPDYRLRRWFTPNNPSTPFLTFRYDELFHVNLVTDNVGRQTKYFSGTAAGTERRKQATVLPSSNDATLSVFDEHNSLIWSTDPLGRTTTNDYDSVGRLLRTTFPEGNSLEKTYDIRGNVLAEVRHRKAGSTLTDTTKLTTYVEGPTVLACNNSAICNKPATETDARGTVVATYTWNSNGQMSAVQGPVVPLVSGSDSPRTKFCYSNLGPGNQVSMLTGRVQKVDATRTRVATFSYNPTTLLPSAATVEPSSNLASLDLSCNPITNATGLNLATSITFDAIGNLSSVDGPLAGTSDTTTYSFNPARRITRIVSPLGAIKRYTYDADGNLITTRRARVASPTDSNPTNAQPTDLIASQWQTETRGYNAFGDLTSTTDAENNISQIGYDANGRKVLTTDPSSRQTATVYDEAGQVRCLWRGGTTWTTANLPSGVNGCNWTPSSYTGTGPVRYAQYGYTGNGKQDFIVDADGNLTDYAYDGLDRPQFTFFPTAASGTSLCTPPGNDGGAPSCTTGQTFEKYSYDENDNKTNLRTRALQDIGSSYDALNRVQTKTPANQGAITYRYDLLNQSMSVAEAAAGSFSAHSTTYDYDGAGRKLFETNDSRQVSYQYDNAGNRARTTWPDGYFISYEYDALNRMKYVRENSTTGNELAFYDYDLLSRRNYLCLGGQSTSCLSGAGTNKTAYTYEADSDLDVLTNVLNGTTVTLDYGHNAAHQISGVAASDTFYLPRPAASSSTTYVPNGLNQYASVGGQASTYDANGNLLTRVPVGGQHTYTYDSENRLVTAAVNGSPTASISYDYDAVGRRVSKTVSATSTSYLLDGDEEIAEYSGTTLLRRYIVGPGIDDRIAVAEGSTTSNPPKTYYHLNHQRSVIALTDAAGNVSESVGYDEHGLESTPCASGGSAFRYTGRRFDPETCLYYYRARYYSPQLGRFLQTDPVGYKDDLNLYAYARNDAVNNRDSTGTTCDTDKQGMAIWCRFDEIILTTYQKRNRYYLEMLEKKQKSYTKAVQELQKHPNKPVLVTLAKPDWRGRPTGELNYVYTSAGALAKALIGRKMIADGTRSPAGALAQTRGNTTTVYENMIWGGVPSHLNSRDPDLIAQVIFVHEGMHGDGGDDVDQLLDGGNHDEYDKQHQEPYTHASQRALEP